jgi:PP-loop superfamily ATP-utilizing enzyme
MKAKDMVLFVSSGDERCWLCRRDIHGEYTHLSEDGVDVIVCTGCFADALLAWVAS